MRTKQTLQALRDICEYMGDTKNKTIIEIGCYSGESTEIWCQNFRTVYAIDPWLDGKGYDPNDEASKNMSQAVEDSFDARLSSYGNLKKFKAFSYDVVDYFEPYSVDFVYIDGEHTYDGVLRDIQDYIPVVKMGGFIGGHDYKGKWQGVVDAVNQWFGSPDKIFKDNSWIVKI